MDPDRLDMIVIVMNYICDCSLGPNGRGRTDQVANSTLAGKREDFGIIL